MDVITVVTIISLCISEVLPLVHNTTANGILHFLLLTCKGIIGALEKEDELNKEPHLTNGGSDSKETENKRNTCS